MPGALLMTAAILAYGLSALDLIQLAVAGAGHIVLGWIYLGASLLSLPRRPAPPTRPSMALDEPPAPQGPGADI
jgi:hypothetical protein